MEQISHDCLLPEDAFQKLNRPIQVESQRTSVLRFSDPQLQTLCAALLALQLLPTGRNLRDHAVPLLGLQSHQPEAVPMVASDHPHLALG